MRIGHWQTPMAENVSLATGIVVVFIAAVGPVLGWALAHEEWLILIGMGVLAMVPAVIRWPVITTFGAYVFLVPFDSVAVVGGGATLTRYVGMLAMPVLLGAGFMERRLIRPPTAAIWWGVFLLWAMLSAAWAIEPSLVLATTPLSLLLLYFITVSIRVSRKELVWVTVLLVLGSALAGGASVFYGVETAYDTSTRGGGRASLTLGDQMAQLNQFAATLIAPLGLAMGSFVGSRRWIARLLSMAALGAICAAIYLTGSRGALVGVVVMTAVFLYRFRTRWQVMLVACLMLGVAATMPATFIGRIVAVADKDSTGAGRTGIWEVGIEALATFGLVGGGFRGFPEIYAHTVALNPHQGGRAPHNVYLGVWVELGIVGLLLMLIALGCHLWMAHRTRGTDSVSFVTRAAEAACYGLLATSFFSDVLWHKPFWLPWILMTWGIQQRERPQSRTEIRPPEQSP